MKIHPPMFIPLISEAWVSIGTNRLRTMLAMLGIIIGVGSVVLMMAIGAGSQARVEKAINSLGNNLLIVLPGSRDQKGFRQNTQAPIFTANDLDSIAQIPSVEAVAYSTVQSNEKIILGSISSKTNVMGVDPDFFPIRNWVFEDGDSFSADDIRLGKRVAVIGASIASKFFPDKDPLFQNIIIGEKRLAFLIVGVLQAKGASLDGRDQDDVILVPPSSFKNYFFPYTPSNVQTIYIKIISADMLEDATDEVEGVLRKTQNIPASVGDNFTIHNLNSIMKVASDTTEAFSLLLGAIASISLLVGTIGIMNIMLVTVSERTREIGIRKAIGATERHILTQFLLEAVMISSVGSMLGLVLGFGGGFVADNWFAISVVYSSWSVLMALIMAGSIGIASGLYPAYKAAKMQPIEALRSVGA